MLTSKLPRYLLLLLIPLFSLSMITACSDDNNGPGVVDPTPDPDPDPETTLADLASNDERFSTLVGIVSDLGLVDALANDELTVFAPTNEAFDAISDAIPSLTDEDLEQIVTYHLTGGTILSTDLVAQQDVEMLQGERTLVQSSAAGVRINGFANVVEADLTADNGVIHAIDQVLLPTEFRVALQGPSLVEVAEDAGNFETLLTLVEDLSLTTTLQFLGPYTAFAPTDDAFDTLFESVDPSSLTAEQLTFILTYHVLFDEVLSSDLDAQQSVSSVADELLYITSDESGVTVNGNANVIAADITEPVNGVIHVIDNVLLPNAFLNLVQVAAKNYDFSTLVELLSENPDLVEAASTLELTVFAPTNDAFDNLFATVNPDDLTDQQVVGILLYHTILGAQIFAEDLEAQQTVESGSEEALYITAGDEGVTVNGSSNVVTADVAGTNGVIHAVDTVLMPNAFLDVTGIAAKNYNLTSLVGVLADAGLVETLQGDGPFTVFAPTNQAFEDISEVLPTLTEDQVITTLLYHVLGAEVFSGDLATEQTVEMLNEQEVTITVADGMVEIEGEGSTAMVTVADLGGTNGVIHIIDTVLLPNLD